ncbi:Homolog of E. coli HemX protein [Georgfuchsia toluolica]|uniref:Homolog of E. coli HemX protein n=1 Tax=Georgfuchsia toluolica TaxID=424218 RepID=A0A916NI57_9PROT|nr:uroporphyrinogen-III C-methyltransferase [Georgfuchsia toluolica]CAG4884141.1 Homolog of E. coli HemX protein [Georgfuchsia toluolica]
MDNKPSAAPAVPPVETAPAPDQPALRRRSLLPLVAAVLAALLLWQWFDTHTRIEGLRQDFAKRLADNDIMVRESRALAKQNQELAAALQARVALLEADSASAQSQQVALESMYQELSRTRDERLLAEVEQSITIAVQQLQLAGNVEAALIALNGADARLAKAAQPQFLPLRKLIAHDIANLTALPVADISGLALKIESIVAQVDSFPMAFEQRPKNESAKMQNAQAAKPAKAVVKQDAWWQALLNDLWAEVRQLIRVERVDHADPGLLPPTQAYFLRENIKLRLVNARLALLARDARSFREDTRQVAEWLDRYFDTQSRPVQSAIATLKGLSALNVVQQAPSLNETLAAVRNFKLGRK